MTCTLRWTSSLPSRDSEAWEAALVRSVCRISLGSCQLCLCSLLSRWSPYVFGGITHMLCVAAAGTRLRLFTLSSSLDLQPLHDYPIDLE